jgi:hypothetical protein
MGKPNLDDKMQKQNEMSKLIKNDVCALRFLLVSRVIVAI